MPMRFVLTVVTPSGASRNHRHRCRRVMVPTSEVGKTSPMLSSTEEFRITAADVRVMRGVGALIQRGGRAVAGMLTIATAGGS